MSPPILLIDDDNDLNRLVQTYLCSNGFSVVIETHGNQATDLIYKLKPTLVILDVILPGLDGLSVCRHVRNFFNGPILILSEQADDIDLVAGLETGADGYLAKPVKPRVLLAHIRALLRRSNNISLDTSNYHGKSETDNQLERPGREIPLKLDRIKINIRSRSAWFDGILLQLTSSEFDLLWMLACHAGKIVSRDALHQYLRGYEYDGLDRTVDQHISKLRKKLGDDAKAAAVIKSIRGAGYILAQ